MVLLIFHSIALVSCTRILEWHRHNYINRDSWKKKINKCEKKTSTCDLNKTFVDDWRWWKIAVFFKQQNVIITILLIESREVSQLRTETAASCIIPQNRHLDLFFGCFLVLFQLVHPSWMNVVVNLIGISLKMNQCHVHETGFIFVLWRQYSRIKRNAITKKCSFDSTEAYCLSSWKRIILLFSLWHVLIFPMNWMFLLATIYWHKINSMTVFSTENGK